MSTYTVRAGDTLAGIAARAATTVVGILDRNPQVIEPDMIFPGQVLTLPESGANPESGHPTEEEQLDGYVVRSGDTLGQIASSFGTTIGRLLELNPQVDDPALIHPGLVLTVPGTRTHTTLVSGDTETGEAAWMEVALREMDTGVDEVVGSSHNPRIIEYHQTTTLRSTDDETPWCSSFVNWCIEQTGAKGTRSAAARSWLNWGVQLDDPRRGSVVVFRRGTNPRAGHVAFHWETGTDRLFVLGGNQDNQVSIKSYPRADLLGLRWAADG